MGENILVGVLCVITTVASFMAWKIDKPGKKEESEVSIIDDKEEQKDEKN